MTDTTTIETGTTAEAGAAPAPAAVEAEDGFRAFLERLEEPEALTARRRAAWERYLRLPMPTRKSEEWRYTDLSGLDPQAFRAPRPEAERALEFEALPGPVREVLERSEERAGVAVEWNGAPVHRRLAPELEAAGVVFEPLRRAARERPELLFRHLLASDVAAMEEKFWSLHVAFLTGGYLLYVPRDVRVERPFHVFRWLDEPGLLVATHSLLVTGAHAEVACIDEYLSTDLEEPALSVAGVEVFGGDGASVRHVSLQRFGRGVKHFGVQHVQAGRDTRLAGFNVALGADLSRTDVTSRLVGPGGESEMLAVWFGDGDQHIDHHTLQHHAAPHARSDLLYKGALTDGARSVFRGLIRVDEGAQLTDAYQTNRNLLLSERSNATALPNLEIEADDVRCSHGATIGQVDEQQVFYLMSRGLTRHQAERLLVFGFFDEVLLRVPLEGVRERVREAIEEKIAL